MKTYDAHRAAIESSRGNAGGNAGAFGRWEAPRADACLAGAPEQPSLGDSFDHDLPQRYHETLTNDQLVALRATLRERLCFGIDDGEADEELAGMFHDDCDGFRATSPSRSDQMGDVWAALCDVLGEAGGKLGDPSLPGDMWGEVPDEQGGVLQQELAASGGGWLTFDYRDVGGANRIVRIDFGEVCRGSSVGQERIDEMAEGLAGAMRVLQADRAREHTVVGDGLVCVECAVDDPGFTGDGLRMALGQPLSSHEEGCPNRIAAAHHFACNCEPTSAPTSGLGSCAGCGVRLSPGAPVVGVSVWGAR